MRACTDWRQDPQTPTHFQALSLALAHPHPLSRTQNRYHFPSVMPARPHPIRPTRTRSLLLSFTLTHSRPLPLTWPTLTHCRAPPLAIANAHPRPTTAAHPHANQLSHTHTHTRTHTHTHSVTDTQPNPSTFKRNGFSLKPTRTAHMPQMMLPRRVRCSWRCAMPGQHSRAPEQARGHASPEKNSCDKQVSSWRHISCHTDKNRYYT